MLDWIPFIDTLPVGIVLLAIGVYLLIRGSDWLVDGAVVIATRMGISTLVVGLTVVAFGTSAPELAVNMIAAMGGNADLSFGNIIGSNIANIGLVLAIGAIIVPLRVHDQVIRKELPLLLAVSAAAIVLAFLTLGPSGVVGLDRLDGSLMLAGFAVSLWLWYQVGKRDQQLVLSELHEIAQVEEQIRSIGVAWAFFFVGLALLICGGKLTETGAVTLAAKLGLSNAIIGLVIVAVATSLPELFTTIIAARKGHADLAVGNVVGSNMFNLLLVLGATAVVTPVPLPRAGGQDLAVMMSFALVLMVLVIRPSRSVGRTAGIVLITAYIAYMTWGVVRELTGISMT